MENFIFCAVSDSLFTVALSYKKKFGDEIHENLSWRLYLKTESLCQAKSWKDAKFFRWQFFHFHIHRSDCLIKKYIIINIWSQYLPPRFCRFVLFSSVTYDWKICLSRTYLFRFFKGCLPQILLGPFLNTLSYIQLLFDLCWCLWFFFGYLVTIFLFFLKTLWMKIFCDIQSVRAYIRNFY